MGQAPSSKWSVCNSFAYICSLTSSAEQSDSAVAVVAPGMCTARVAALFPEAQLVAGHQLDPIDPLGALPCVELRRDHAHRPTVLDRQRLTIDRVPQQDVRLQALGHREVRAVVVVRVAHDKASIVVR